MVWGAGRQAPGVHAAVQLSPVFLMAARVVASIVSVWRTRSASCSWVQACSDRRERFHIKWLQVLRIGLTSYSI